MDRSVSEAMGENATPEIKEDPKERMDSRYRAIERLIREAGKKMVKARPSDAMIHQKEGLANFCTDYDMEIQKFLIKGFSEILPGAAFLASLSFILIRSMARRILCLIIITAVFLSGLHIRIR